MKKIFVILSVYAAVIGCQKAEMDQISEAGGVKVPVKITADIAQTKTTMTNVDGVLKSEWKEGDKIYVSTQKAGYYVENTTEFIASNIDDGVEFTTASDGIPVPTFSTTYPDWTFQLFAEYPAALNGKLWYREFSMSNVQTQLAPGDLSHIEKSNILIALPVATDWTQTPISVNFNFQHLLSVLEIDLKGEESGVKIKKVIVEMLDETGEDFLVLTKGTVNLKDEETGNGKITQKEGTNVLTLELASPVELSTEDYDQFYMTISPGHAGQIFNVKVLTDMEETLEVGSMKVPDDGFIPQGAKAIKKFTVKLPEKEVIDYASAIDLSASATANTYIVNTPNTLYKFKADVMGNGVVPTGMVDVVTSTEISPKSALSLWYTCKQTSTKWVDAAPIDIFTIELKDGYIYFKTPETFVNGNIVIAAFAEEGLTYPNITVNDKREFTNATILWSWDIWAVEGYNPETSKIQVGEQYLMDRNLGALVGATDSDAAANITNGVWVANAQGLYYEFGRKDPFPGFAEYPANMPLNYGQKLLTTPAYTLISALQMNEIGASKSLNNQMFGTIEAACKNVSELRDLTATQLLDYVTQNPHKDINGTNPYNWQVDDLSKYWKDMWGGSNSNAASYKTIYDPCPTGWKLWEYSTMENFAVANEESATLFTNDKQTCLGVNVAGSLFPFSGGRNYSLELNGYGSLLNCNPGTTVPIALYTSAPYYYLPSTNKYYSGGYAATSKWIVTVVEDGLSLSMTSVDEDNNNRSVGNTETSYTSRAVPTRCVKE